jgi:hypothetical protein
MFFGSFWTFSQQARSLPSDIAIVEPCELSGNRT